LPPVSDGFDPHRANPNQDYQNESPRQVMYCAMVMSVLSSACRAEEIGLPPDQIVLSCKMSGVQDLISVYRALARQCDYTLHLGLTEAGMAPRAPWPRPLHWQSCCRNGSATRSASP
jgi:hypothetical protein